MRDVIVITEQEIRDSIARYEQAMRELAALLGDVVPWSAIGIAFGRWSEGCDEPWQVSYIEAKHYIAAHGIAPWYDASCTCAYCVSVLRAN